MSSPAEARDQTTFRATAEEYLHHEYDAEFRHEWRDGVVVAMAGGSPPHSLIIANAIIAIGMRLRGKSCRVYESNLRVRSVRYGLYTYPDLSVICGQPEFDPQDEKQQTIINPKLVVEVLSPSTEGDDRGEKFERYRAIDSLEEYVLVSQKSPKIETFYRKGGTWIINRVASGLDESAELKSLGITLPLAEVYAGVEFPPENIEAEGKE